VCRERDRQIERERVSYQNYFHYFGARNDVHPHVRPAVLFVPPGLYETKINYHQLRNKIKNKNRIKIKLHQKV
jgi:hypothetical protein